MTDDEETCVFDEPDCGPVVMWCDSGEPWCDRCRQQVRKEAIAAGLNDPARHLQ